MNTNKPFALLFPLTALIASHLGRECKQAIISRQEDKQINKCKEEAIKYCKEKTFLSLPMSGVTFHFLQKISIFDEGETFSVAMSLSH